VKTRAAQARRLDPIWHELGEEEREVLLLLAARLLKGQREHGVFDLARDPRDWTREKREEALDLIVYNAVGEIARQYGVHDSRTKQDATAGATADTPSSP
jgi:hypothetical protein